MNFNEYQPIYIQIIEYIKYQIINGELKPKGKVPSVRELAARLKVNPNTVQRAYQELERENVFFSQRGMGSFIINDPAIIPALTKEQTDRVSNIYVGEMKKLGYTLEQSKKILEEVWN